MHGFIRPTETIMVIFLLLPESNLHPFRYDCNDVDDKLDPQGEFTISLAVSVSCVTTVPWFLVMYFIVSNFIVIFLVVLSILH